MIVIGNDTKAYLNDRKHLKGYIDAVEKDLVLKGITDNYVTLTELKVADIETLNIVCIYLTKFPNKFNDQTLIDILEDHADLLVKVGTHAITLVCSEDDIVELVNNPTQEIRSNLLEKLISN